MKNETTSKKIASDAGKLLKKRYRRMVTWNAKGQRITYCLVPILDMDKIRGALGSALTQTKDRKK
jgi:hypothetical protein